MSKQVSALQFSAASVAAIVLLPRLGLVWTAVAVGVCAILYLLVPKRPFSAPKAVEIALNAWNYIALGGTVDLLSRAFPEGGILIGLLILLVSDYAAGRKTALTVGTVASFLLIILYGVLFAFSLPELERPTAGRPDATLLFAALAPLPAVFLREEEKKGLFGIVGFAVLSLAAALVSNGADFYTAMKSVRILGVMERLEPLVSVAIVISGTCLMTMLCAINEKTLRRNTKIPLHFFLGCVGLLLSRVLGATILAVGTAIFWGVLPILPLSIENPKKFEKNEKNA
ncbi:MAG: hypothetical protein E7467_04855 [Ruminococcaceae bacterium]|nr:hypothetical protein [Oscillospiraceae bacterium]